MRNRHLQIILFISICLFPYLGMSHANKNVDDQRMNVVMRTIGHEVLLSIGDSTSRILPIEKIDNRYEISFESDFEFEPQQVINTINQITQKSDIINNYLVEVASCETNKIVHSYEVQKTASGDWLPCSQRAYPKACYEIWITLIENQLDAILTEAPKNSLIDKKSSGSYYIMYILILPLLFLIARSIYAKNNEESSPIINPNIITIGKYQFDKRNMMLTFQKETTELTGKEADLLLLLHSSANTTLERENILKNVWGDEGDYVGRTLDVFISKLRKKIAADPNLKIINIRGTGYKLVVND